MSDKKIIKRYQNRKLYDTQSSRYVTLDDIANMVKEGHDIQVIDNRTHEDLTSITLAQIIFELEKKRSSLLPLDTLKKIVQHGGESIYDFVQKYVPSSPLPLTQMKEDLERNMDRLVKKGELTKEEAKNIVKDISSFPQRGVEDFQKKVDERIKQFFERLTKMNPTQNDIKKLERKLTSLEKKLSQLESNPDS